MRRGRWVLIASLAAGADGPALRAADPPRTPTMNILKPEKSYSRVLQQQGRIQTDADWNEQGATLRQELFTEMEPVLAAAPASQSAWALSRRGKSTAALRSEVQSAFPGDPPGMRSQAVLLASLVMSGELLAAARQIADREKAKNPSFSQGLASKIEEVRQARSRILRSFATSKPPKAYAGKDPQGAARAQDASARYTQFVQLSTQLMSELQSTERELMDALQAAGRDLQAFWAEYSSMADAQFRKDAKVRAIR